MAALRELVTSIDHLKELPGSDLGLNEITLKRYLMVMLKLNKTKNATRNLTFVAFFLFQVCVLAFILRGPKSAANW